MVLIASVVRTTARESRSNKPRSSRKTSLILYFAAQLFVVSWSGVEKHQRFRLHALPNYYYYIRTLKRTITQQSP
jgi:hypothetical protein